MDSWVYSTVEGQSMTNVRSNIIIMVSIAISLSLSVIAVVRHSLSVEKSAFSLCGPKNQPATCSVIYVSFLYNVSFLNNPILHSDPAIERFETST